MSCLTLNSSLIFLIALTSTEISTPIRHFLSLDLWSGKFYISHQRLLCFCFSFQINIYAKDVWLFSFKIFLEPRSNGNGKTKQIRRWVLPLALQRCPIVYCLSFSRFLKWEIADYFKHNVWEVQTLKTTSTYFKWGAHYYSTQHCSLVLWVKFQNVRSMCKNIFL